jgi:tRNA G37 N-methylase Trm5
MSVICEPLSMARKFISACVSDGDQVIDSTAGNGHDTLFLAKLVGEKGRVFAFDIQPEAIAKTRNRLEAENFLNRVHLIQKSHDNMKSYVCGKISAAMFNLGYLPGGEHRLITRPDTTVKALEKCLQILCIGGIVTLVIYTGHDGGNEEKDALLKYCSQLNQQHFKVVYYSIVNQINEPPSLLVLERLF